MFKNVNRSIFPHRAESAFQLEPKLLFFCLFENVNSINNKCLKEIVQGSSEIKCFSLSEIYFSPDRIS